VKVACFCPEHGVKRLNHRKEIQVSGDRFENITSIQLAAELKKAPVAYFSIGSLEHHGLHLPAGLDAMWIHQACLAAAEITGGVVLPPTFWGTGPCLSGIENLPGSLLLRETTIRTLILIFFRYSFRLSRLRRQNKGILRR